ncbi:hypothetical protein ACHAQA_009147 [Verticillium albo-atrum]
MRQWTEIPLKSKLLDLVSRVSARVFIGPELCTNNEWLEITKRYTMDSFVAAQVLRSWPAFTRPIVHWFLPECRKIRQEIKDARRILKPVLEERRERNRKASEAGEPPAKVADAVGWMDDAAKGYGYDAAVAQIGLAMAAIHTTTMSLCGIFFDLMTHREYIEPLREEIRTVLAQDGWKKTSLFQLRLMDSLMKESQRHHMPDFASMQRFAEDRIELSDGTTIPKGARTMVTTEMMRDPSIFPEPYSFNGKRYLEMRQQPGSENRWQFVTTSPEHLIFGHGKHACPGRFFASNEIKIVISHLLMMYDWKMAGVGDAPLAEDFDANPEATIMMRRRKEDMACFALQDYDCFYASVLESQNPALKSLPLGVKQKSILATCNYVARARGVRKLMLISAARKVCPDLVVVEGEDLTPFRDVSKVLYGFLRSHSWSGKVERLGLDEVFMDVTDMINYNMSCLNKSSLANSFFCLSKKDPEKGFPCDLTGLAGCVHGTPPSHQQLENQVYVRLLLGSHLGWYLRTQIEEQFGFTSACGVSTNKLLSKLVGSKNKPRNQTTLLAFDEDSAVNFIDAYTIRKIPGIGGKTTQLLERKLLDRHTEIDSYETESALSAREVRVHPDIYPETLEKLLSGPGSEQGIGVRIWNLLHGVDYTEVKDASDVPSQISIEDTYRRLESLPQIEEELKKLATSLLRRMRVDLLTAAEPATQETTQDQPLPQSQNQRWIAHPKTLRLSIRLWPAEGEKEDWSFSRSSKSQSLPNFVFNLRDPLERIAERLVAETLFPMLLKFHPERGFNWNLQLINICVANMVESGSETGPGVGRDISAMFRKQDDVLRQWKLDTTIVDDEAEAQVEETMTEEMDTEENEADGEASWENGDAELCRYCGHSIPPFAASAHARYHAMGD